MKNILVLFFVFCTGCYGTSGVRAVMSPDEKLEIKSKVYPIDVYFNDEKPVREYKKIDSIEEHVLFQTQSEAVENIKKRTRELDGDAIILERVKGSVCLIFPLTGECEVIKGIVIKYTDKKK